MQGHKEGDLFAGLVDSPAFRSDLLYFIRLAGNYAAQIFIDMRARAQKKHRAEFQHWLGTEPADASGTHNQHQSRKALLKKLRKNYRSAANPKRPDVDDFLWQALILDDGWFDPFKKGFTDIVRNMPGVMQSRLERALKEDHALPWDLRTFEAAIGDLREYRHYLEHYEERSGAGPVGYTRLLEILGLMLIPHLSNHLVGRVHHHGCKLKLKPRALRGLLDNMRQINRDALALRKGESKFINGLKRRIDEASIRAMLTRKYDNPPSDQAVKRIAREEKKKRKDLEQRKTALIALHNRYFDEDTWPRYNHFNFLLRYGFIGKSRIAELEDKLFPDVQNMPVSADFIHDIEPLYLLSSDIALVLHGWLSEQADKGLDINDGSKAAKQVRNIRNTLAHGDFFWMVPDLQSDDPGRDSSALTLRDIIAAFIALKKEADGLSGDAINKLITTLEALLKKQKRHFVYLAVEADAVNAHPPPIRIRRWSASHQSDYNAGQRAERQMTLQRRNPLRQLVSGWMRELSALRKE